VERNIKNPRKNPERRHPNPSVLRKQEKRQENPERRPAEKNIKTVYTRFL